MSEREASKIDSRRRIVIALTVIAVPSIIYYGLLAFGGTFALLFSKSWPLAFSLLFAPACCCLYALVKSLYFRIRGGVERLSDYGIQFFVSLIFGLPYLLLMHYIAWGMEGKYRFIWLARTITEIAGNPWPMTVLIAFLAYEIVTS